MNHSPVRQPNESQEQYRKRRIQSRIVVASRTTNLPSSGVFTQHFNRERNAQRGDARFAKRQASGQSPKPIIARERKPKQATKPTWPKSDDQKSQSRPLIVLGKNRERDAGKREKPKSAVSKRMDRPSRVAMMESGHAKLMRFLTGAA